MNNKKIVAGLLALSFVFGGAVLPSGLVSNSVVTVASADSGEYLDNYDYYTLPDGTIAITRYYKNGKNASASSDTTPVDVVFPSEIDGCPVSQIGEIGVNGPGVIYASQTYNIRKITIPEGVKTIGDGAFSYTEYLEYVELPDTLETVGRSVFENCNSLKEVTLPKNLSYIGKYMFESCENLKSVSIPDSIKTIGQDAFKNCDNLTSIVIPKNVTEILGDDTFLHYEKNSSGRWERKSTTIYGYTDSVAQEYADNHNIEFHPLDLTNIKADYSEQYHQIRFTWDKVDDAQQYGIAVYLAGRWRIQAQNITGTTYTTPKNLTPGKTYKVAIAAKVNGKWYTSDAIKNAITVTVK